MSTTYFEAMKKTSIANVNDLFYRDDEEAMKLNKEEHLESQTKLEELYNSLLADDEQKGKQ